MPFCTNLWYNFLWKDEFLKWNPSEWGGVDTIRVPIDDIWKPDVLLYNSISEAFDTAYRSNAVIYSALDLIFPIPYFRIGILRDSQLIDRFRPFQDQMSGSRACSRYRDNTPIGFLSDFGSGSRFYSKILPPDSAPNPYSEVKKFEKKFFLITPPLFLYLIFTRKKSM